jgi:hypothetical protein
MKTCRYCGRSGYPDYVDRRECCDQDAPERPDQDEIIGSFISTSLLHVISAGIDMERALKAIGQEYQAKDIGALWSKVSAINGRRIQGNLSLNANLLCAAIKHAADALHKHYTTANLEG